MTDASRLEVAAWQWPEIVPGDDLAARVAQHQDLLDGDVVVLTSKVVSKAEGRLHTADRADVIAADSSRVVARRGPSVIAETAHGLTMAAAGVDASNVAPGVVLSLPVDPDGSARLIRERVWADRQVNVAVIITDTAGRAWRVGQTDMAIGCAGIDPFVDLHGSTDTFGNILVVTAPAIADELAAAADLVKGKSSGRPIAVVRGLGHLVLVPGSHGGGAAMLVRDATSDLFGLGARDAVDAAAHRTDSTALQHFPARIRSDPEPFAQLASARDDVHVAVRKLGPTDDLDDERWSVTIDVRDGAAEAAWIEVGRLVERVETLAAGHRLRPADSPDDHSATAGWRAVSRTHWIVA